MTDSNTPSASPGVGADDPGPSGSMARLPGLGILWAGIGAVGFMLMALLIVGLVLPGTWTAQRERLVPATPSEVYGHVADLSQWEGWTHWPELSNVENQLSSGIGVSRSWDDPNYGRGTLTLVETDPDQRVRYEVRVDGGIRIDGEIVLERSEDGTLLRWTETGAFGRNPLLRYTALSMDELQGAEMDKALDRLSEVVATRVAPRTD